MFRKILLSVPFKFRRRNKASKFHKEERNSLNNHFSAQAGDMQVVHKDTANENTVYKCMRMKIARMKKTKVLTPVKIRR